MIKSILRKFKHAVLHQIKKTEYLLLINKISSFQKEINAKKKSHKIIALVMSNVGQQQFFEDIYRLSVKNNNSYHYFIVNDCYVKNEEKIDIFQSIKFITPGIYRHIKGIDLALHAEISCRSRNVKDVCYVGHGFPGKHTKWSVENLNSFNHYFLYGPRDRHILNFVVKDNPSCISHMKFWEVGYPKYDAQLNSLYQEDALKNELGLDPNRNTLLFAPAWDPGGALRKYGVELLDKFGGMQNFNVIIKLHPASLVSELSKDYEFYTGKKNWALILKDICEKYDNIYLYKPQQINPLFKLADVLVTDFSGVAMGFFIEDKPVVCIDCPEYFEEVLPSWGQDGEMSKSNDLFNNGRNASYIVENLESLESVIKHSIEFQDELSSARKKIAVDLLYNPGEGTSHTLIAMNKIFKSM
ncbi:CDP-glycerol glycerophosphotransferase family protein [Herminiimonas arsenitoxidans]|uniref:CDP-glycerol glycerophosphotransferase family protein n=1 Tax=Herminiimonas arsenitoxidans TaxID=1809410 RepID=UPI0009703CB2|nr:CDP-glycerol glycerophosphotransferase family protein [Herminiimonas arsenitoxidans]